MDDDATSGRPNEGVVVVERTIEVVPGVHVGIEGVLAEEVENEFGLRETFFPEVSGEVVVDSKEYG